MSHRPGKGRFTPAASPSARLLHGIVVPEISDQIANGACSLIQAVPQTVAEVKIHPNAQPEVRDEEPIVVPCPTMDTAVAEIPKVDKPKDGQKPLSDILKDMRRTEQEVRISVAYFSV